CLDWHRHHRALRSFPTRRSSDLWYQRIAMYPLAVVLPLAAWRRDYGVRPYALAVAGLGILVSAYHNVIETNPDLSSGGCDPSNPDRKSTRLNSSHVKISYAVFCL